MNNNVDVVSVINYNDEVKKVIYEAISAVEDLIDYIDYPESAEYFLLHGGCYTLYKVVDLFCPYCKCMVDEKNEHCAIGCGDVIYDARCTELDRDNFREANGKDFSMMEEYFTGQDIRILSFENLVQRIIQNRISEQNYIINSKINEGVKKIR